MTELRETVAAILAEAIEEAGGAVFHSDALDYADRILALPELAALKLTIVKPLNLGASISTDKRDPV